MILFDSRVNFTAPDFETDFFDTGLQSETYYIQADCKQVCQVITSECEEYEHKGFGSKVHCITVYRIRNPHLPVPPIDMTSEQILSEFYVPEIVFMTNDQEEAEAFVSIQATVYEKLLAATKVSNRKE